MNMELLQTLGFPAVCLIAVAWYLNKVQAENRQDMKEQNERIITHLKEVTQTNQMLLDTNATLVRDINMKLDKLIEKGN